MLLRDWDGPLKLRVNQERFLRELPNFFASFHDALSELLQNAYRAGASRVAIELDYDARTLRVADDGRGSTNAQAFLTAGETGWDESRVIDPAGLGFFALLGLSEEIGVTCRASEGCGWQMTLTQEAFNGAEVAWQPIREEEGPQPTGCVIMAKLLPRVDLGGVKLDGPPWENFRQYFPLAVELTRRGPGAVKPHVQTLVVPSTTQAGIDTPVGRLTLVEHRRSSFSAPSVIAVWEHRGIESKPLWLLLRDTILNHTGPEGQLMWECLRHHDLVWFIDPTCAVRPKLPDRNALIQDEPLKSAVRCLVQGLLAAFDAPGIRAWCAMPGQLPDEFERCPDDCRVDAFTRDGYQALQQLPLHGLFDQKPRWLLELAGYESTGFPRYDEHEYNSCPHDGGLHIPEHALWVRGARRAPCFLACEVSTRAGDACVEDLAAPRLELRVTGAELIERWDGIYLGRCERIELWQAGVHLDTVTEIAAAGDSDCLMLDGKTWPSEEETAPKGLFLTAGTREEFLGLVAQDRYFAGWLFHVLAEAGNDDYVNYGADDEDDSALNYDQMREDLRTELITHWWPTYKVRAKNWERTAGIRNRLAELRSLAYGLEGTVKWQQQPHHGEPIPELAEILAFAEQIIHFNPHLSHYQVDYQELEGDADARGVAADHEPDGRRGDDPGPRESP